MLLVEERIKSPQKVSWGRSVGPLKLVALVISRLRFLKFYIYTSQFISEFISTFLPFLVLPILLLFLQTTCLCVFLCDTWDIQDLLEIPSSTQKQIITA